MGHDLLQEIMIFSWWLRHVIIYYQCLARLFMFHWFWPFLTNDSKYLYTVYIYMYIFLFIERGKSLSLIQLIAIFVAISSCLLEKLVEMDLAVPLFDIKIEKVFAILCTFQPSLRHDASGQKVLERSWLKQLYHTVYIYIYLAQHEPRNL